MQCGKVASLLSAILLKELLDTAMWVRKPFSLHPYNAQSRVFLLFPGCCHRAAWHYPMLSRVIRSLPGLTWPRAVEKQDCALACCAQYCWLWPPLVLLPLRWSHLAAETTLCSATALSDSFVCVKLTCC